MTSRDLAGVTRDKTENGEFCLLPAVLFFFFLYHFFCQGWRGRETKLIYKDVLVYTIFFTLFFS